MRSTFKSIPAVLAIALVAGTALPVMAAESGAAQPRLSASSSKTGGKLFLNGKAFHTTSARIANQRLFTFANSSKAVITWDEYTGGAKTSMFALSLDGSTVGQVTSTENKVRLVYDQFDPLVGEPAIPAVLQAGESNELFLVQFVATPIDEMRRDIVAAGGTIERFLTDNTHIVRMNAATRAQVTGLPYVRWVGAYHPAYRVSSDVRLTLLGAQGPDSQAERYSIECMRAGPVQQQAVADLVNALGGVVEIMTPDQYRLEATLSPAQLAAVVACNEISYIDPWGGPGGTDMNIARQIGGASTVLAPAGFLGQGVRGEIHDTGVVAAHQQWNGQAPLIHVGSAVDSHGNACYGINFATGTPAAQAQATGMCPQREQGIFLYYALSSQFGGAGGTRLTHNTQAVDPAGAFRSCYQTSSVGSAQITNYSTISAEVDDYLFKIDYLSCQSQSNTGTRTSRPQAWAKDIVSVGGIQHNDTLTRTDDVWSSASYGPAADNRAKPDLSHFYESIYTTYSTSTTGYGQFGGTSGATPITAGHFGLLHQMWHQGVWQGFGGASSVFLSRPKSTTAKALMVNGAYRYFWAAPAPVGEPIRPNLTRDKQGWGMPDLGYLYNNAARTFIVNADQPVANGETKTYFINVDGTTKLNVTMCYIDPAGSPAAAQCRINDLTLRVTAPDGVTFYYGNNGLAGTVAQPVAGTSNWSTPGGSPNTWDTVENVFIETPAAGQWKVEVIGAQVVQDAYPTGAAGVTPTGPTDAAFSLVVTGGTAGQTTSCYANCDNSTVAPILNVNDFICFQQKFAAGDTYANCDGSTTAPILNVNDFICFQQQFAAGCP